MVKNISWRIDKMTEIYSMPVSRTLDYKFSELTEEFYFFSDIVGHGVIPKGFVCDWESVPLFKGTSKVGGLMHDYYCRRDSVPVVTKKVAADIYLEFMKHRKSSWWRSYGKYWVVRFAPGYFHKKLVDWKLGNKQFYNN